MGGARGREEKGERKIEMTLGSLLPLWRLDQLLFPVTSPAVCQTLLHTQHTG